MLGKHKGSVWLGMHIIVTGLLIVGCGPRELGFEDILGAEIGEFDRLMMRSGTTGDVIEVTDPLDWAPIITSIIHQRYFRADDQRLRAGYTYYLDFYSGDIRLLRMTFRGESVSARGTFYTMEPGIAENQLEAYFIGVSTPDSS